MFRTLTLIAAAAALMGSAAQAESITVSLAGKAPATIHADIHQAARKVCMAEMHGPTLALGLMSDCVRKTVATAEATIPAVLDQARNGQPAAVQGRDVAVASQ